MRAKIISVMVALATISALVGIPALPVQAVAYGTSFTTSVTYQNVGSATTTSLILDFYATNSATAIPVDLGALNGQLKPLAASSIYVGGLNQLTSGFQGSAVLSSDQPIVATLVQVPPSGSTVKNRPLSNGFSAGAPNITVATVLKNSATTNSSFSVQNVDTVADDLTVNFYAVGSTTPITVNVPGLPAGSAKYFDMATLSNISASSFTGSVQIAAVQTGTSTPGSVVATALELGTTDDSADAFESTSGGSSTVYMPSAFCNWGSSGNTNSFYAIQNVSTSADAVVTVTYSNSKVDGPYTLHPGTKQSVGGCTVESNNFIGSATITSTGGQIVAIGKIRGAGISTAFVGATAGAPKLAAPYVRFTTAHWVDGTKQRAYIAVQNVGAALNPNDVKVAYYDKDGNLAGTYSYPNALAQGAKFSTSASDIGAAGAEFGFYSNGIGGAAVISGPAGSQLVAVVRIQTYLGPGTTTGEDYNATPIQ